MMRIVHGKAEDGSCPSSASEQKDPDSERCRSRGNPPEKNLFFRAMTWIFLIKSGGYRENRDPGTVFTPIPLRCILIGLDLLVVSVD